jgi:hypothetical protein
MNPRRTVLMPPSQSSAEVLWVEAEHCTNVQKRKRPFCLVTKKPLLGFARQPLLAPSGCMQSLANTIDGILKHRVHKYGFGSSLIEIRGDTMKLLRQDGRSQPGGAT